MSIRGRILSGVVTKTNSQRTTAIRRDHLLYMCKYNCFKKRHKNMSMCTCSPASGMSRLATLSRESDADAADAAYDIQSAVSCPKLSVC
ncbi:40S ribosomal protein S11 [Tupaia chinensis]|uniref:40S ribosomal protein S11 n=1 Tax=Tupaia chinensis TaxID=246437 RepID=L9KZX5_TUPCH|nr:40S ribosomal protein S11 [Tupaia chinensis]